MDALLGGSSCPDCNHNNVLTRFNARRRTPSPSPVNFLNPNPNLLTSGRLFDSGFKSWRRLFVVWLGKEVIYDVTTTPLNRE
jgi:hypothetical protein